MKEVTDNGMYNNKKKTLTCQEFFPIIISHKKKTMTKTVSYIQTAQRIGDGVSPMQVGYN